MADTDVSITAGSGTKIDTRTVGAGVDEHRQVIVIGDPGTAAGVAPVDATAGLKVDSELPAAAALSDSIANPTSPTVGVALLTFDGTDWARLRSFDPAGGGAVAGGSGGLLANIPHLWDGATGGNALKRASILGDAEAGHFMPGAADYMWNGSAFDRIRGDTTNGLDVDVTRLPKAATATTSQVADNASSVTILASNAARLGATITNDSSARLYIRLGAAVASTTNYSFSLAQHESWEPTDSVIFTGEIRGIWATDPGDGGAKVTELT